MKSDLPKVLQPLAGRPLLSHVLDAAKGLQADAIHVVYGHGGERVREALASEPVSWVLQAEQLGTGHAVAQAMPAIADDHNVLILYGDVPLVRARRSSGWRCRRARIHRRADSRACRPDGYGRVVRDGAGNVVRIVEQKDANTKERAINEINTGLMAVPAGALRRWLAALRNDNAQGEYYLTDIIVDRRARRYQCERGDRADRNRSAGRERQGAARAARSRAARRKARRLMLDGVTLADPLRIDMRGEVVVGRDVFIDVNVVMVGKVELGDRVRIGPNCYLRDCRIDADTEFIRTAWSIGRRSDRATRSDRSRACVLKACCTRTCTSATSSK